MYTGFVEEPTPEGSIFYLKGAFGGQVQAAVGKPQPAPDGTGLFYVYFGNHPAAAAPIMTQNREELVAWLETIISGSHKTMQQDPALPPAAVPAAQPAPAEDPLPTPPVVRPELTTIQRLLRKKVGPRRRLRLRHPPAAAPAAAPQARTRRVTAAAQQQQTASKSGLFRFVSYREEFRGLTEHGNPPRRLRHWLLKDGLGREHVAVDTIFYHQGKKRFTYAAMAPFSEVRPLTCYNMRSVLEYLDQFVPPEARQAPPPEKGATSPRPAPKSTPKKGGSGGGGGGGGGAKANPVADTSPAAAAPKQTSVALVVPQAQSRGLIADPGRRAEARETRVATVAAELEALASECGVQYSLTLMSEDGMQVLTSGTVQQPGAVAAAPPAALPAPGQPSRDQPAPAAPPAAPKEEEKQEIQLRTARKKRPAPSPSPAAAAERDDSAPPRPRAEKRPRRDKKLSTDPADDVAALVAAMESNTKMYVSGRWYRDPLAPHPLEETLEAFAPAEDCGEMADRDSMSARLGLALPPDAAAAPGATTGPPKEDDILVILDHGLPEAVSENDVELQATWGLDAYTRQLLTDVLARCPETPDAASRASFIDKFVLPALNSLGEEGWDVVAALRAVERRVSSPGAAAAAARAAAALEGLEVHFAEGREVKPTSRKHVRAHPKGEGVIVKHSGGLPAGTFLGEYLGEVVTAWRWAERDTARRAVGGAGAAAARRLATRMGASPEYYSIALERPKADSKGYDVLYVDAVRRGNFVSRLGHACEPNCRSVTVAVGGRLTVGVWTMRDVAAGEELTMDFAGETENEREAAAAVCLCGTEGCRGSFLYVNPAPGSPLNAVLDAKMTPADRLRLLLHAAAQSTAAVPEAGEARLAAHGFKDLLLADATGASVPAWLRAWTAAALEFVQEEAAALRATLPGTFAPGGDRFTAEDAAEDAEQLVNERIHSLATVLDRAKLFLRHQESEVAATPPLVPLDDVATAAHLWAAPDSVARRLVAALAAHAEARAAAAEGIGKRALRRGKRSAVAALLPRWAGGPKIEEESTAEDSEHEANGNDADGAEGAEGDGDEIAELRALAERLSNFIDETDAPTADAARAGLRRLAGELLATGRPLHLAAHDILTLHAATRVFMAVTEYRGFASVLANGREGGRYRPTFLLALLAGWPRTSVDEYEAHNADRKGCMCLPDVESAYAPGVAEGGGRGYAAGDRGALLRAMASAPRAPWPRTLCTWLTFRTAKVYGSPQLDAVLRGEGGEAAVTGLAEAMLAAAKG